jgi:hypothetical protein
MPMKVYEAILSQPDSLARVQTARRMIERAGGIIKLAPPTSSGMVFVTLVLPDRYLPQDFLAGLPFYPV